MHRGVQQIFWYPETYSHPQGWAHWTPTLWIDGVDELTNHSGSVAATWADYSDMISARRAVPSPLEMDFEIEYGDRGDTGTVHVEVVATDTIPFTELRLHYAIIEFGLNYPEYDFDQALRDYFPTLEGYSLNIAEGDTFTHSEDFVIDSAWVAGHSKIVAFVQDDTTREVLQSIQHPVVSPVPDEVSDLTVTLAENDLLLDWSAVTTDINGSPLTVDRYQIYRNTTFFFEPGSEPFDSSVVTFYVDASGVVSNTLVHYFYTVAAVSSGKESTLSGVVGEFDRNLITDP